MKNNMKKFIQDLKIAESLFILIGFGVLGYAASIIYQDMTATPSSTAEETRIEQYDKCLETQWQLYSDDWDRTCMMQGMAADCPLSGVQPEALNESFENGKMRCAIMFAPK